MQRCGFCSLGDNMTLPTKMSFDKKDAERWEGILRAIAEEAEEQGEHETARMYYACAAIMYDISQKLKPPTPPLLS